MPPNKIGPTTPPRSPIDACIAIVDPRVEGKDTSTIPVEYMAESAAIAHP